MPDPTDRSPSDWDETRATARLPNLDIEILHRRAWEGDGEQLQVTLTGTPSLEAAGRMLELANPMLLWMRMAEAAWAPWLALMSPVSARLPKRD